MTDTEINEVFEYLLNEVDLDHISYTIRENLTSEDMDELPDGAPSWEHPKLTKFGDVCGKIRAHLGRETVGTQ